MSENNLTIDERLDRIEELAKEGMHEGVNILAEVKYHAGEIRKVLNSHPTGIIKVDTSKQDEFRNLFVPPLDESWTRLDKDGKPLGNFNWYDIKSGEPPFDQRELDFFKIKPDEHEGKYDCHGEKFNKIRNNLI